MKDLASFNEVPKDTARRGRESARRKKGEPLRYGLVSPREEFSILISLLATASLLSYYPLRNRLGPGDCDLLARAQEHP